MNDLDATRCLFRSVFMAAALPCMTHTRYGGVTSCKPSRNMLCHKSFSIPRSEGLHEVTTRYGVHCFPHRLMPCAHTFHRFCIDKWLEENSDCPVCKADIVSLAEIMGCRVDREKFRKRYW